MSLRVLGTSDSVLSCECCGRVDLKKTVALGDEDGNVRYYGTECAARAMGVRKNQVEKDVRSAAKAAAESALRDGWRKQNEEWAAYDAWKMVTFGDTANSLERRRMYRAATGA